MEERFENLEVLVRKCYCRKINGFYGFYFLCFMNCCKSLILKVIGGMFLFLALLKGIFVK